MKVSFTRCRVMLICGTECSSSTRNDGAAGGSIVGSSFLLNLSFRVRMYTSRGSHLTLTALAWIEVSSHFRLRMLLRRRLAPAFPVSRTHTLHSRRGRGVTDFFILITTWIPPKSRFFHPSTSSLFGRITTALFKASDFRFLSVDGAFRGSHTNKNSRLFLDFRLDQQLLLGTVSSSNSSSRAQIATPFFKPIERKSSHALFTRRMMMPSG